MAGEIDFRALSPGLNYSDIIQSFGAGQGVADRRTANALQTAQLKRQTAADARDERKRAEIAASVGPDGAINEAKARTALANAGDLTGALSIDDHIRTARMAKIDAAIKENAATDQLIGSAVDQPSYDAAKAKAQGMGLDVTNLPPVYDKATVGRLQRDALTVGEQLKQQAEEAKAALEREKFGHTVQHDAETTVTARRAQDLSHSDAVAGRAVTLNGQRLSHADAGGPGGKAPSGYRFLPNGTLQPIPGGPGDNGPGGGKPLTESQAKATGYFERARTTNRILEKSAAEGNAPPGAFAKGADEVPLGLASSLISEPDQNQLTARRGFIAAVLRQESGASISAPEFNSYDKLYFPQQGDKPSTVAEKANLRARAVRALAVAAGPGAAQMQDGPAPAAAPRQAAPAGPVRGQTAINRKTGERLLFDGRQWKPAGGK